MNWMSRGDGDFPSGDDAHSLEDRVRRMAEELRALRRGIDVLMRSGSRRDSPEPMSESSKAA